MSFYDAIRVGASGAGGFEVKRSLRFNDDDSAYLNRTPSSSSNRKTFTISWWFKRGNQGTIQAFFGAYDNSTSGNDSYYFSCIISDQGINLGAWNQNWLKTNRLFRDPSSWYHCVVAYDTTQSTADNRVRMYINGVEETSFAQRNNPSQNFDLGWNFSSQMQTIGRVNYLSGSGPYPFDGYIAEFNSIDGLALDASYFGETDPITGQWIPKKYTGSYGTNGFYLNFSDNSGTTATTLGKDSSGNGNNFTPNNFSVSAGAGNDSLEDTPTNNFPTFNPIFKNSSGSYEGNASLTDGNLAHSSVGSETNAYATFALPSSGKYYWELRLSSLNTASIGIIVYSGNANRSILFNHNGTIFQDNASAQTGLSSWSSGDTIGVAYDGDNQTLQFYRQGSSQGSALSITAFTESYFPITRINAYADINFGQRAFSYTAPTGYKKLCSANLPDPTILLPNKHFDTLLYTGNGSSQTLSGLNFAPDWVWIKIRSQSYDHAVFDTIRGATKDLEPNQTGAEQTRQMLTAFTSDGFSVGNDTQANKSGDTFVAWNWDAGDTDGKTYTVTVVDDSGNKYRFDGFGTSAVTLDLAEGGTYIFDQSDSSNAGHPLRFSTTSDGTHGGGSEYTTGVTTAGTPGSSGAYTQIVVAASAPTLYYYCSSHSGMGGQVNTNSTLGSSNFDGSVQSTVKVNATAGFSITKYTGTGSTATIGHGLGVAPDVLIVKNRDDTNSWNVYHVGNAGATPAEDFVIYLDQTSAKVNQSSNWNDTAPTSSVFTVGSSNGSNGSSDDMIAYCFSEVAGYSKFGSYTGNGNADGTFVFTGFRPAFLIIKRTDSAKNWFIHDNKREGYNPQNDYVSANISDAETNVTDLDLLSNGFKLKSTGLGHNASGGTYIYLAFSESPFKNARAR